MSTDLIKREWPKVGVRLLMFEQSGIKDALAEDAELLAKKLGYQRKLTDIQKDKETESEVMRFTRLLLSLKLGLPLSTKEVENGSQRGNFLVGLSVCSLLVMLWVGTFSGFYFASVYNNGFWASILGAFLLASLGTFLACSVVSGILYDVSCDYYEDVKFINKDFDEVLPDKFVSIIAKIVEQSPDTRFGVFRKGRAVYSCQDKSERETIRIREMFLFAEVAGQRLYLDHAKV